MDEPRLFIDEEAIGVLARHWGIRELALFGSVLRDDLRDDSDVDQRQLEFPASDN